MSQTINYKCPVCGLHYQTQEIAKQCQAFCAANNACNMDIASQAIEHSKERSP